MNSLVLHRKQQMTKKSHICAHCSRGRINHGDKTPILCSYRNAIHFQKDESCSHKNEPEVILGWLFGESTINDSLPR